MSLSALVVKWERTMPPLHQEDKEEWRGLVEFVEIEQVRAAVRVLGRFLTEETVP